MTNDDAREVHEPERVPQKYDAVIVVSFGGPEGPDDVIPFLENVLRGRNVPQERLLEVAAHYQRFGGKSPINEQNRQLIASLERELADHGPHLPIYFGNRNWHPLLADTLRTMAADGVRSAVAFVTSAFSTYSGCRQYRENILQAQRDVGPVAPHIEKLRVFYNHPSFIEAVADRLRDAQSQLAEAKPVRVVFTAHSIPVSMAQTCRYEEQLREAATLVAASASEPEFTIAYQSRSGPPTQPWLEPDICDVLRDIHRSDPSTQVVIVPIGFLSDHMEVVYDLDTEARAVAQELGLAMVRAKTVGTHPAFISMIRELIQERLGTIVPRSLGANAPSPLDCVPGCCPAPVRPADRHSR